MKMTARNISAFLLESDSRHADSVLEAFNRNNPHPIDSGANFVTLDIADQTRLEMYMRLAAKIGKRRS